MLPPSKSTSSPSTSSVFLPLARRVRRDSKASIAADLDQDALNEALDSVHSVASQSQGLTVFNEYTDPPSSASKNDTKSLAADLSGGITGLYTKLKATVGVATEGDQRNGPPTTASSQEVSSSKPSSSKASTTVSPRPVPSETPASPDFLPQPSKASSKATSVSKMSLHSPAVRSPTGPLPPISADPAITNTHIYADKIHSANHSRTGSGFDRIDEQTPPRSAGTDMSVPPSARKDEFGGELVKIPTRTKQPLASPLPVVNGIGPNSHLRQDSNASGDVGMLAPPAAPVVVQDDASKGTSKNARQERILPQAPKSNPLQLLGHHASTSRSPAALKPTIVTEGSQPSVSLILSMSTNKSGPKVPQSKLPGYPGSQASSTDSAPTTAFNYSEPESINLPESLTRPRTPDTAHLLRSAQRLDDDDTASLYSVSREQLSKTPTMSIPVRRPFDADSTSRVIEMNPGLPRPSSSRSLKHSQSAGHGHKRNQSKQQLRSIKAYHEERAPFQRRTLEDVSRDLSNSAFHRDSIIDPDLEQYLSDDASSAEDDHSATGTEKLSRSTGEGEKSAIAGLLAAVRKGRSRIGDRSIAGLLNLTRDSDEVSIISTRQRDLQRSSRRRNLSVASSTHQRATPRTTRERLHTALTGGVDDSPVTPVQPDPTTRVSRMIRSASMHGHGAPAMELNKASIQHVHKLLQQLLRDADVPRISSWEDALVPILLKATDDVDPDVQGGDDIDIRNYVKLKKVLGGRPGDTSYISGVVFTKNVALKSMSRLVMSPRILIVTFALEYARHEQHFMSLDPVIRQEREYLEILVSRIATLKPDVLLAQKNVSGLALQLLDKARITTVYNVKSSVLEAVSRCTQSRVVQSVDKIGTQSGQLGTCESFEVKTFMSEGRKKTYVYLSGCPPQLGCTIAIRGADKKTLSKIKRITDFMIYVVYNLKLETCLMRDEWAQIPNSIDELTKQAVPVPPIGSLQDKNLPLALGTVQNGSMGTNQDSKSDTTDLTQSGTSGTSDEKMAPPSTASVSFESPDSADIPDDIPVPTFYEDLVDKHQTKILSASPFVRFMQPYLLMKARELERRVAYLRRLRDQDISASQSTEEKSKAQKFTLIQPEMLHASLQGSSKKVREAIHAVHDTEYDKALDNYETQKRQWETYLSGNRNLFDPYAHQNIVVLFSHVATETSVPCHGPDLLAFNFYSEQDQDQFEADCTLGQYVEDLCIGAKDVCTSSSCEKRMYEHHRQYVHGEAQVSVFIEPHPAKMRGLQDIILMWSSCRICSYETTVAPMSVSTWKYSFGKYLELSFWSADLHARAAGQCNHDLHRDHLRYFGYKDMAICVRYDPIDLLEIIVPRMRVTWKVDNDLRFRNEVYTRIENRVTRFTGSVKLRLKSINADAILPENIDACKQEIEKLTKKANDDHAALIKQLQEKYSNSRHWEIIPLNRVIHATQEKVAEWDALFTEFEQNFFPSEKDIRRLATLQLKKIFLDRDVSVTSLLSDNEGTATPPPEEAVDEKQDAITGGERPPLRPRTTTLSPEKTHNVLQAVLEEHASPQQVTSELPEVNEKVPEILPNVHQGDMDTSVINHLDLALPPAEPSSTLTPVVSDETTLPTLDVQTPEMLQTEDPMTPKAANIADPMSPSMATPKASTERILIPQAVQQQSRRNTPPFLRAQSTPAASVPKREPPPNTRTNSAVSSGSGLGISQAISQSRSSKMSTPSDADTEKPEKKLSERFGLAHFRKKGSLIPRAVSHRKESRVSNLAKHFEQLARDFERERRREIRLRATRTAQSRVLPLAAPKPIVEVYRDVDEAVDEPHAELFHSVKIDEIDPGETAPTAEGMAQDADTPQVSGNDAQTEDTHTEATETEGENQLSSHAPSDAEESDLEELSEQILLPDSPEDLLRLSQDDLEMKEFPKHERKSLMQMLTTFWAERSSSGWAPLEYPLLAAEHVFSDCDIIVREDEPSSIIAFALNSSDYKTMLHDVQEKSPPPNMDGMFNHTHAEGTFQADVMHSLLRKNGTHLKYQFAEGPAKMLCKIFFAEQFDAVRRKCGVADRVVESLSRCLKWDSKGGKTKSLFLKTLDDRFVLKSLSPIETQSFLKFAPNYFQIMSEAFFHELPSVIAKMLGFYQIVIKNPATGVEYNWYLLLMENLFYDRSPTRIFDLKGSMRNRKIRETGASNEVLLDENMVEFIYESPLFAREHSKKLLRSSVHNDTLFLARQNVMDYSLMIAIDEVRKELVVGIIDCIRTYTWDKKLESWIKDRGFVNQFTAVGAGLVGATGIGGVGKRMPTVTSPKEYKRRFREAMGRYVLEAPNCWHQFAPVVVKGGKTGWKVVKDGGRGEARDGDGDGEEKMATMATLG
ncbi:1-phosphatidylinositol 3-phosphate 5-kinase fab1 [Cyphellophora attinorum]|uniref:1-phosphatidylinositol-3-phosphate 5-kinase n=1 Tax=Cyphellophora attinorum TaxID=1664694 RepID=A0A0N0NRZ8_9EURO|nr:1-phosphatidylinositol 3-phosphate 5-kinase fab1 [Phialophora attinorum]KPI45419.1 1-phosphatidylinositol 3-phosphate 5-kinase fab1 [Phialophora attinorum]